MPREAAIWFGIAWPAAITILARLSMVLTDLAFLGHFVHRCAGGRQLCKRTCTALLCSNSWGAPCRSGTVSARCVQIWMGVTSTFLWMSIGGAVSTLVAQAHGAGTSLPSVFQVFSIHTLL